MFVPLFFCYFHLVVITNIHYSMVFAFPSSCPVEILLHSKKVDTIEPDEAHEELNSIRSFLVHVVDNLTVILPQADPQTRVLR